MSPQRVTLALVITLAFQRHAVGIIWTVQGCIATSSKWDPLAAAFYTYKTDTAASFRASLVGR
jgi:hypothetical protein